MRESVTHLIVAFNHARYVEQAIHSALRQTIPTRLVIVDDASTDGTQRVIREVLDREHADAVFVSHTKNRGLTASLNDGLREVKTEFFAYFAGDDWVEPQRAELQSSAMRASGNGCVLSYSDCYRAADDGRRFGLLFSERHAHAWRSIEGNIAHALLSGDNWLPAPTLMCRTEAVRTLGGYDERLSFEDLDICLRLARLGEVAFVPTPIATHREHGSSLGGVLFRPGNPRWVRDLIDIERKHLGAFVDLDEAMASRIRDRVLHRYIDGEDPRWVDERFRETKRYLRGREPAMIQAYRLSARIGLRGDRIRAARDAAGAAMNGVRARLGRGARG